MDSSNSLKIDFLCVGFQKCATTTLDAVLRQHPDIVLPGIKEVHLDMWHNKYKEPMRIIEKKFFRNIDWRGKKVGIIDPELENDPKVTYKCFGCDAKLIFIMRNPVDRIFSFYKMALSLGYPRVYASTLNGERVRKVRESFSRYVRTELKKENKNLDFCLGNYIDTIIEYSKYYDRKNMKFIIFEEYVKDSEKVIKEIYEFLDVPYQNINTNIWTGKGNVISKNKMCFNINNHLHMIREYARCDLKIGLRVFNIIDYICKNAFKITTINNNEKMSKSTKSMLEKYYKGSKERLEVFLGRDLTEEWF